MFGHCMRVLGSAALGMALLVSAGKVHAQQGMNGPWLNNGAYGNTTSGYQPAFISPSPVTPAFSAPSSSAPSQFTFPQGMSGYYSPSDSSNSRAILVDLHVPGNAQVWFDGNATEQTGDWRSYVSQPVDSDNAMHYEVRARWTDANGRTIEQTRRVAVHAGQRSQVDFLRPAASQQDNKETLKANPKATEAKPK